MKIAITITASCILWASSAQADKGVLCKLDGMSNCHIDISLPNPWARGLDYVTPEPYGYLSAPGNMDGYDTAIWVSGTDLHNITIRTIDQPAPAGVCRVEYLCTGKVKMIPIGTKKLRIERR